MPELPQVSAVEFRRELTTGTTRPCVFLCESDNDREEEYVTKMRHDVRDSGLGFECIAFHLATYFGIDCPPAALVHLSLDLAVAQRRNQDVCDRITRNVGLNFGSTFLPGYNAWLQSHRLPSGLHPQAVNIVAFDALIDNADRRKAKPNLLVNPSRLVVIDHELSFSFLRLVGNRGPWFQRLQFLLDHPLYEELRGRDLDLREFRERLIALDDVLIDDICFSVPREFAFDHSGRIAADLKETRSDADGLLRGIQEVLR
ncbi:MAG: HipA family kinase [Thermoanaerobaculia bacterium]